MRPRKLTSDQVEYVREIARQRQLIPTQAQLAHELGVSKRLIEDIQRGRQYAKRFTDAELDEIAAMARAASA